MRSVLRAAQIAEALYRTPGGKTLSDLSLELHIPKTTVLRLLRSLVVVGAVEKAEGGELYHRSPSVWLAAACDLPGSHSPGATVRQILNGLQHETGMMASLGIPDPTRRRMIMVGWYMPMTEHGTKPGGNVPAHMHATAVGQAYLASLPPEALERFVSGELERVTGRTVTSREQLLEELARVRRRGYAVCRGTSSPGRTAVAVPVRDGTGRTVAAISLAAPEELVTRPVIENWLPLMRRAAEGLSALLTVAPTRVGESQAR